MAKVDGKGTDQQFNEIVAMLAKNIKSLENGEIKHIQYVDKIDSILSGDYGWSKTEFRKEMANRIGHNVVKEKPSEQKKKVVKKKVKK